MLNIRKTLGSVSAQRRKWEKLIKSTARLRSTIGDPVSRSSHLQQTWDFGSNPGALRMLSYRPPNLPANGALVVVLHGCTQSAAGYDHGAGWSTLADRFGFALLLPEQQRSNNPNGCFNWFQPGDIVRGGGEALSIRQMVQKMVSDHGIDPNRVFVTGLSAGGAMTSVMLATYPDVFAGGALIAGLPYGAASNVQQAFENMYQCPPRPARVWGDLVRAASPHQGPWPRISVWHGGADATVIPLNAKEIVKQWTNVHGLPEKNSDRAIVDGYSREVWTNAAGEELIESYTIAHMAHGTPLATGDAHDQCGAEGPFLLEVGISSSYHIAKFFGLTAAAADDRAPTKRDIVRSAADQSQRRSEAGGVHQLYDIGDQPHQEFDEPPEQPRIPASAPIDVGAMIKNALKAAGLIKEL